MKIEILYIIIIFHCFEYQYLRCTGVLKLNGQIIQTVPYSITGQITTVMYVADSTCRIREDSFHYISSDPAQKGHLTVPLKVCGNYYHHDNSPDDNDNDNVLLIIVFHFLFTSASYFFF